MAAPSPVEPSSRSQALHAELHQLYLLAASEQDGAAYVPLDSDDRASYRGLALAQYTTWVAKSTFSLAEFSAESSAISAMTDQGILGASLVVVCALVCDYSPWSVLAESTERDALVKAVKTRMFATMRAKDTASFGGGGGDQPSTPSVVDASGDPREPVSPPPSLRGASSPQREFLCGIEIRQAR